MPVLTAATPPATLTEMEAHAALARRVVSALTVTFVETGDLDEVVLTWTGDSVRRNYPDGATRIAVYIDASVPENGYGVWAAFDSEGVLVVAESLEDVL